MTVINLSKKYRREKGSLIDAIRSRLVPDLYWASSLSVIREHFLQEYPKFRNFLSWVPYVCVDVDNCKVKRMWPDSFDENDGVSLRFGLDEGLSHPIFILSDETTPSFFAPGFGGDSNVYLETLDKFNINRETPVPVKRVYLGYHCYPQGGLPVVLGFDMKRENVEKKPSLLEEIRNYFSSRELMPAFS